MHFERYLIPARSLASLFGGFYVYRCANYKTFTQTLGYNLQLGARNERFMLVSRALNLSYEY